MARKAGIKLAPASLSPPGNGRSKEPRTNLSGLQRVQKPRVYVIAANQLADKIREGVWSPGTRLPAERELSEMLGISRASLRQALIALESIGILHNQRGSGHYVVQAPADPPQREVVRSLVERGDPQELLEARKILEPNIARLAAIYRDDDDLTQLYDVMHRMKQGEKSGDFSRYIEADFDFHIVLALATHNPVIIDLEQVIVDRMELPPAKTTTNMVIPKNLPANRQEHQVILDAVTRQKPKEAFQAMVAHLATIAHNLRRLSDFSDV